jgi:hypothetical protein
MHYDFITSTDLTSEAMTDHSLTGRTVFALFGSASTMATESLAL